MMINANGINLHVTEAGRGATALVFLHYWGGSSRTWDRVIAELSGEFRTVALDQRGWGESDKPEAGYSIADLADDAQQVIAELGLTRYVLVGHSMGGKVAQLLASRRPGGLAGLALVAPTPPTPTLVPDEQRKALTAAYDSRESVEWVLDNVLTAKPLEAVLREQVIADSLRGSRAARVEWTHRAMPEDISSEVASIDVPVIVISGEEDQVDRVETLRQELLPRINGARLHVLARTGHLSPLEAPGEVAALLREFARAL